MFCDNAPCRWRFLIYVRTPIVPPSRPGGVGAQGALVAAAGAAALVYLQKPMDWAQEEAVSEADGLVFTNKHGFIETKSALNLQTPCS